MQIPYPTKIAAFGWFVGDLAQAVKAIYQVGKALKDTGGTSDDYQETEAFLRGLFNTLDLLKALEVPVDASGDGATFQAQVNLVYKHVQQFLKTIDRRFERKLGSCSSKGAREAVTGGSRKA